MLPDQIATDAIAEADADSRLEHQLVAEKTDEVWQQATPFVCDAFALDRGRNWQSHENVFWEQHPYMGMREDMYAGVIQSRSRPIQCAIEFQPDRPTTTRSANSRLRRFAQCSGTPRGCSSPVLASTTNSPGNSEQPSM